MAGGEPTIESVLDNMQPLLELERDFIEQGYYLIAGVDEVGRGALAGPVGAGAVVLPLSRPDLSEVLHRVRDSKVCTPAQREQLVALIRTVAVSAEVAFASEAEIDHLGIAAATRLAMRRAIEALQPHPEALVIDWVRLNSISLPQKSLPKGDQKSLSVASASIVAKVARDHLMITYDTQYPGYGFASHKGYGTPAHLAAIEAMGPSPLHRLSFDPLRSRLIG